MAQRLRAYLPAMVDEDRRARWSTPTFLVAFVVILIVLAWLSFEFLLPLVMALSAAVVLDGWNERLVRLLGGRRGWAALVMTFGTFFGILAPLTLIVFLLVKSAIPLIDELVALVRSGRLAELVDRALPEGLAELVSPGTVRQQIGDALASLAARLGGFVAGVPAFAANLAIDAFVTFVALFAYFARGPKLVSAIVEATPMERRHTQALLRTAAAAIRTVLVASLITALIQFGLGYLGFRIVGVPFALGLAAMMAFFSFIFSLVPVLGSGLVWVPVGATLILTGRPVAGIFVLAWGAVVLGSVDNVVKPLYAKGQMRLSPLLLFVTLFGGIGVFGPIGALLGPLIAALAGAFLRIWTTEFLKDAEPLPHLGPTERPGGGRLRQWLLRLRRRRA